MVEHGAEAFSNQFEQALGSAGYADFSDAWLNRLGFELHDRGETERALLVLKKNAELFPQEENTFDSLAYVYEKIGNEAAAIANYRKALAINPEFASSLEGLARLSEKP